MNPIQVFVSKLIANYIEWDANAPDMSQNLHYSNEDLKAYFGWSRITVQRMHEIRAWCNSYGIETTLLLYGINVKLYKKTMVVNYRDFAYKEPQ